MKLEGSAELARHPEEVFDRLLSADLLQRCIPGCESMDEIEPGVYDALVRAGIGPVKGSFRGTVTVSDVVRPESYRLSITGKSTVGHVQGAATLRLEPAAGGTRVSYDGEATVSGMIASVGGRLVDVAARKVTAQFFDRLQETLSA